MEAIEKFIKDMEKVKQKEKIVSTIREEQRTEDVEKMSNFDNKIKVYAKWKELREEIVKLEDEELKNFMEVLKAAIKFQDITFKFSDFLDNEDFEKARNMTEEMQTARNKLATESVKFLKV